LKQRIPKLTEEWKSFPIKLENYNVNLNPARNPWKKVQSLKNKKA
jgi:hypothetical protein